jgi:hypothetical protein
MNLSGGLHDHLTSHPLFSLLGLRQERFPFSSGTVLEETARQNLWRCNGCWWRTGEATSSNCEQELECLVTVVEQSVFQYVTWVKSYEPFNFTLICGHSEGLLASNAVRMRSACKGVKWKQSLPTAKYALLPNPRDWGKLWNSRIAAAIAESRIGPCWKRRLRLIISVFVVQLYFRDSLIRYLLCE